MNNLVHLHNHTYYSLLDGEGSPEDKVLRAKELGQPAIAFTDHGVVTSHVPAYLAGKKHGVQVILGCEMYLADKYTARTRWINSLKQNAEPHITVLAENQKGYENLMLLVEESYRNGFYNRPRIDLSLLIKHQRGLIVTTGCPTGFAVRYIDQGTPELAFAFMKLLSENIDHVVVEIVAQPGYSPSEKAGKMQLDFADALKRRVILTGDNHFTSPKDHPVQQMMSRISTGAPVGSDRFFVDLPAYQYVCTREELIARAIRMSGDDARWQQACDNTLLLAKNIDVELKTNFKITFSDRGEDSPRRYIGEIIRKELSRRLKAGRITRKEIDDVYMPRILEELRVLDEKKFLDYVLVTWKIVNREKSAGHPVHARGSGGGSLVLHLMGITALNPIQYDLSFDRFFNRERPKPPDIDVDCRQTRRPLIHASIVAEYGEGKVAQLSAFSEYSLRSAVIDVARMNGIKRSELEEALSSLGPSTSNKITEELEFVFAKHPCLLVAVKMVGQIKTYSRHAAGLAIANEPLNLGTAIMERDPGVPIASIDKYMAEDGLNILKLDLLIVSALDVIGNTLLALNKTYAELEDEFAHDLLNDEKWKPLWDHMIKYPAGTFQVDGTMLHVLLRTGCDSFLDVVKATALCRPGAMHFLDTYIENKASGYPQQGPVHDILRPTFGLIVLQETAMQLARLSGFTIGEAYDLLKVIAKSGNEKIKVFADKMKEGLIKHSEENEKYLSPSEIDQIIQNLIDQGKYSFNYSHGATYSWVTFIMAYLKMNHPQEYYLAYLNWELPSTQPNYILVRRLLLEMKPMFKSTIPLFPLETLPVAIRDGILVGGFQAITGSHKKKGADMATKFRSGRMTPAMSKIATYLVKLSSGELATDASSMLHWFPLYRIPEEDEWTNQIRSRLHDGACLAEQITDIPRILGRKNMKRTPIIKMYGYITARRKKQRTINMPVDRFDGFLETPGGGVEFRIQGDDECYKFFADKTNVPRGSLVRLEGWYNGKYFRTIGVQVLRKPSLEIVSDHEEEATEVDENDL